ncbi:MAG: HAD family phosphatase [Bryobacterales bacterium]|nr:HAD family phosphatase [Bryobacterales bacterium]
MLRTLIFDLGRVLISFDFQRGYTLMGELCGLPSATVRERLFSGSLVTEYESGQIGNHEFHRRVQALLETPIAYEQFCEVWSSIFLPDTLIPEPLIAALHAKYRMVLLSNTNGIHFEGLRTTRTILRHFDAYVLSHEVKAMKPSPLIYAKAIEEARCAPAECFFTDDIPAYVEGAKLAGIDAVQFQSAEQIEAELRARGVDW